VRKHLGYSPIPGRFDTVQPIIRKSGSRSDPNSRSITTFRASILALLEREALDARRSMVIFALDGIPHELAVALWPNAHIEKMRSVFPTTSSSAWLSSLSGAGVEQHGIPGIVFKLGGDQLINVYQYKGPLGVPPNGNIFSDAARLGYLPISVRGDWEAFHCAWLDVLLNHSRAVFGYRFYTATPTPEPDVLAAAVLEAVSACLEEPSVAPQLIWCFIEVDRHIHDHGYDEPVLRFLERTDEIAMRLVERDVVVVAHSDHGLIRTNHDQSIERLLAQIPVEFGCAAGGAGRTRWFYPRPGTEDRLVATLQRHLPATVRICSADEAFGIGSLACARVGEIVLIAEGDDFVTFGGHSFDHGSSTEAELYVPYAHWNA
jgi:hypothetical protein